MSYATAHLEKKRAEIISRMSLVILGLTVFYYLLSSFYGVVIEPIFFILFGLVSLATYFLNKSGKTGLAKALALIFFNILFFLIALSEPFETGIHFHFISSGCVALVVYGYEEWPKGIAFISLSLVLYVTVYLGDISFLPQRTFDDFQTQRSLNWLTRLHGGITRNDFCLNVWRFDRRGERIGCTKCKTCTG